MRHQSGQQTFFLPADGIDPEVIDADLGVYVGRNAHVQIHQVGVDDFQVLKLTDVELLSIAEDI